MLGRPDQVCDVCGRKGRLVARSSRFGPVTHSVCLICLQNTAEPLSTIHLRHYLVGLDDEEIPRLVSFAGGEYRVGAGVLEDYASSAAEFDQDEELAGMRERRLGRSEGAGKDRR